MAAGCPTALIEAVHFTVCLSGKEQISAPCLYSTVTYMCPRTKYNIHFTDVGPQAQMLNESSKATHTDKWESRNLHLGLKMLRYHPCHHTRTGWRPHGFRCN